MLKKFLLPILIILGGVYLFYYFESNPVKAKKNNNKIKEISYIKHDVNQDKIQLEKSFLGKVINKSFNQITEVSGIINYSKEINNGTVFKKGELIYTIVNNDLEKDLKTLQNNRKSLKIEKSTLLDEIKNKKKELELSNIKSTKYLLKEEELKNINISLNNNKLEIQKIQEDISKLKFIAPYDIKILSVNSNNKEYVNLNSTLFQYADLNNSYIELSLPSFILDFSLDKEFQLVSTYGELDDGLNKVFLLKTNNKYFVNQFIDIKLSIEEDVFKLPKEFVFNGFVIVKDENKYTKKFLSFVKEDSKYFYTKLDFTTIYKKED